MSELVKKYEHNPIIKAGKEPFRNKVVFNPGVIYENNKYYLYERSAESLTPFKCNISLLESVNGIDFTVVGDKPIITPESIGFVDGTVEDPRVVKIDDDYLMTYAYRPYTYNCYPNDEGLPNYEPLVGELDVGINHTLTAVCKSKDLINFKKVATIGGEYDERDCILFPEKINGRYAMLRRPKNKDGGYKNIKEPSIWISYSDDLTEWDEPELLAKPKFAWEANKIGGGATPLKTDRGWIIIYHGVSSRNEYKVGIILSDLNDPTKILARSKTPIMAPTESYETKGVVLPNVVFPTGNVIIDNELKIYYGVCDTAIALATINMDDLDIYFENNKE